MSMTNREEDYVAELKEERDSLEKLNHYYLRALKAIGGRCICDAPDYAKVTMIKNIVRKAEAVSEVDP